MKTLKLPNLRSATLTLMTLASFGAAALAQPASAEPHHDFVQVTVVAAPVCVAPAGDVRVVLQDRPGFRFDDWRIGDGRRDARFVDARTGFDRRDR